MNKYALLTVLVYSVVAADSANIVANDANIVANGANIVANGANIVANGANIVANGVSVAADEVRGQILDIIDKNVRSFMTSSSVQAFFKRKCAKNPDVDSYDKTQEATDDLMNCVSTVFDSTSLSDLDFTSGKDKDRAIFERYCTRSSEIMHCVRDFASILSVCFDKDDKGTDNNTSSIISKIMYVWLLYSCHGNKLMSFLKMGGSKCVESKKDSLHRCGEPIDNYLKIHGKFSSRFPSLMFEKSQCGMISNTRQCVVDELSKCDRPTAAVNYYSSLFDVFRDMSPCSVNKATLNNNNNNNNYNRNIDLNTNENKNIIFTIFSSILLMIRSFDYTGSIRQIIPRAIPCLL